MGFIQAFSACINCGVPFFYNPVKVPSVRVNGSREPICKGCVERANPIRVAKGLPEIVPLPDAYDACDESEL
jgi:hypothetical protein